MRKLEKVLNDPGTVWRKLEKPFHFVCDTIYYNVAYFFARVHHKKRRVAIVLPDSFDKIGFGYRYAFWRILRVCGVTYYHTLLPKVDLAVAWQDQTIMTYPPGLLEEMTAAAAPNPVVNAACTDIRKSTVGRIHQEVFGYSLDVDCETFRGTIVRKSEENFRHDGVILEGPVRRESGYVYQRLVDNELDEHKTMEYRVPVVGSTIPIVISSCKPISARFGNPLGRGGFFDVRLHPRVQQVFSDVEIARILEFARRIGCDYGDFDILRSNSENRIYIVDCNHTPGLRGNLLQQYRTIHALGKEFEKAYFPAR